MPGTGLAHVVSLYEFDHELRMRLGDVLSTVETAFRFFIGHRLGRIDAFAHRHPWALGATRQEDWDNGAWQIVLLLVWFFVMVIARSSFA